METNILDIWIKRIAHEKMPVLSHTVNSISKFANDERSHRSALTNIILHDPAMTAHVLRLANSVFYSPHSGPSHLNTVSRAVVILGVNEIRSICVSAVVISELLKKESKEHVIREMARSFHAAVQARDLVALKGEKNIEEVFIAALLYRIGDMAFWVFGESLCGLLEAELTNPDFTPGEAEQAVLGFRLSQLSAGLCKEWHLGELVQATVKGIGGPYSTAKCISLCYRLAKHAENGWDCPEVEAVIEELSVNTGIPVDKLRPRLKKNAQEAIVVANDYGAASAAYHIPLPPELIPPKIVPLIQVREPIKPLEPNPMLQLQILRELSVDLTKDIDVDTIIEMILEGIYRGVGMDRVMFALLMSDKPKLIARNVLGADSQKLLTEFEVKTSPDSPNIFQHILLEKSSMWVPTRITPNTPMPLPAWLNTIIGQGPFYTAAAVVNAKSIGIFYADRKASGRALDADSFESFAHFCLQANLSFDFLNTKNKLSGNLFR